MSNGAKAIIQNIIIALLTAARLFCSILLLSYSWVKIVAVTSILVPAAIWLVTHGSIKKTFKYIVVGTLIFAISFTSLESYLLLNAGYPPPTGVAASSGVTIAYPSVLNISLTGLVDNIEKSPTFALLTAEHGKTIAEVIQLQTDVPGGVITVNFFGQNSAAFYSYTASAGYQYHV